MDSRPPSPSPAPSVGSDAEQPPPAEEAESAAPPRGDHDGGAWGFSDWARDDKVSNCPRCQAQFGMTFRRHHCKQCGGLVCDNCSRHWMRLPRNPAWGKVRVCNECAAAMQEDQAAHAEEDLAVNAEIIKQIQKALKKMHEDCDTHKVVLLKLDAEATGDFSPLEEYARDPEGPAHAFAVLRDRAQQRWATLLQALEEQSIRRAELEERCQQARGRLAEARGREEELAQRRAELDAQLAAMDRARAERDELVRREAELTRGVAAARRQVDDLQRERAERLARQAQRQARWGCSAPPGQQGDGSGRGGVAFTISTGRQDALLPGRGAGGRLEGCRRSCELM